MGMGPTVGHYQFEGWDLPTKYGWMHSGPGVRSVTHIQDLVHRMGERMIASGELVGRLLGGAEWAGAAATAAGQAMQRGAGQITQTAAEAATAQRCVTELGESFQTAQRRVPAPNEVPSGLGDKFLYGAAEGFTALSPFDVQSPLHDAMEQRRELDQQANLALTDHMTTSRDRVEAIPAVAAPAPIVLAGQGVAASGGAVSSGGVASPGGAGQPAGPAPAAGGFGGVPAATTATGWAGVPATPPTGPGLGGSGPPGVGTSPPNTGLVSPTVGRPYHPQPGAFQPAGAGPGGGVAFGPGSGRRTGATGAGARGGAEPGARPGAGGDGIPSHGVPSHGAPGREGLIGGPATPGPRGGGGGAGNRTGSFMQPAVVGRGDGADDTEHRDRYAQQADHIVGELPLVAPAVIGETPDEERRRLGRSWDGQ